MPSPVIRCSAKITCPDCSPPSARPRRCISSITYLSPTGQRTMAMPRSRSAISRPMLLITVATIASPGRRPSRFSWSAAISSTASPSTTRPRWSTNSARSPSPSNATPIRAPVSTTRCCSGWRCVDPQSRLMLRPSGSTPSASTWKPSDRKNAGRDQRGRAVGAVEHDVRAAQRPGITQDLARVIEVGARHVVVGVRTASPGRPPSTTGRRRSTRPGAPPVRSASRRSTRTP